MEKKKKGISMHNRAAKVFLLCLIIIIQICQISSCLSENLLNNGSFEVLDINGLPEGWLTDAYVLEEGYTVFSVSENDAVQGNNAACIRNIGENDARYSQKIEIEPDSLYCFSGYIRTENVEDGHGANLSIEGLYTFSESVYETSDGWQYIEWYGETGPDQTYVTLYARLGGYSGESRGTAWFDNLKLEKVDMVPGSQIAAKWYKDSYISYYDDEEEDAGTASPAWPRLIVLTLIYTVTAILLTQWLRRGKEELLQKEEKYRILFIAGLLISLVLRLILSSRITGYEVDINCFYAWGHTMAKAGPAGFYPESNFCDYPPAYTYILGLNSLICQAIPDISEGMKRVVFRFFPALCDILSCIVLESFLRRHETGLNTKQRITGLLILAFHPVLIINSAAWGQMDSVLALLLLLVAIWAIEGKWALCLPCYMLAVLVKPQALMLGFLGLAAIILTWLRCSGARKKILFGLLCSAGLFLAIVVPFSLRQKPLWIIDQYANTLSSYPYATINTANFYYLLGGNWSPIQTTSPGWFAILNTENWTGIRNIGPAVGALLMALMSAVFAGWYYFKTKKTKKTIWIELVLFVIFTGWYIFCGISGANWNQIGIGTMAFAFVIILSLYIRKGDITFLPFAGGLLFTLLYVFGIKMHERYIFPAIIFFALAYCQNHDKRILYVLLSITCTTFINEGIVLDNSIRLGSASGHLNQDTYVLAIILSIINCLTALYAVRAGMETVFSDESATKSKELLKDLPRDNKLHWRKKDTLWMSIILITYSFISFSTLGSLKAPQTAWTSTTYAENVVLDLGEEHENFTMLYFARVSRYDFSVAVSADGINWEDETWAQMDQGQCWKWKYVTNSTEISEGKRQYDNSRHWFNGRYIRITAHQINLSLCEVIFRDENGKQLPVSIYGRNEGDTESALYSDATNLVDEQDSMEAMPVYFITRASLNEDEENPGVAQPSWWNSTYFDEIYHARTAWEFLQRSVPYETSHPPLGKVLMSMGVAIFGMTPFGWRVMGALAGVGMLALIYLISKQLTKSSRIAVFSCSLFSLDCMHFTQTQIATIDSFPVLFILMSYYFMLRFIQSDWRSEKNLRILTDLGLSGLSMGLAIASKWIGIYAGAGLGILFFWHLFRIIRLDRKERTYSGMKQESLAADRIAVKKMFIICGWCVLFFVLIPVVIYLLSYIPYFAYRQISSFGEYLQAVLSSQQGMLNYHSTPGLGMDHPFYSPWYEWPVIGKPMFYSTKQYIFNDELSFSIFCFGNPVIWWAGIPAILFAAWCWVRNREERLGNSGSLSNGISSLDTNLVFLLIGFLAQYFPWTLVPRGTYIYHYFASVPFLILAISILMDQIQLHKKKVGAASMIAFGTASLCSFILFFPYVSGIMAPLHWLELGKQFLRIWY